MGGSKKADLPSSLVWPSSSSRSEGCPDLFSPAGAPLETPVCEGKDCLGLNCTWNPWSPWSECSRSCGVGQQQRLRTYHPPGQGGHWCQDILTANLERRFCNLPACKGKFGASVFPKMGWQGNWGEFTGRKKKFPPFLLLSSCNHSCGKEFRR